MNVYFQGINEVQLRAIDELSDILNINVSTEGILIKVMQGSSISIKYNGDIGEIIYSNPHEFYRCLSILMNMISNNEHQLVTEKPQYESLGVMIDCSRNAVIKVNTFKKLIRHLSLMGYSTIQLYLEDTLKNPKYSYIGYLRGAYCEDELKEMDAYASMFGIELVPCIQTLAHLKQVLKWSAYNDMLDLDDILLIDSDKTYNFIDDTFNFMSKCINSRKINIGMDEAHMVGLGKYLQKNGYTDRVELILRHLNKVIEIANKYNYEPMMWSDMFFRLLTNGEYNDNDITINNNIKSLIPEEVSLIYWDYYSTKQEIYDSMFSKHKLLSDKTIFAGGAWKWTGFFPSNQYSISTGALAHKSCVKNQVKDVIITAWGDNGAEASLFSILPTLQYWAELCYRDNTDNEYIKNRFFTCTKGNFEDFLKLDEPNYVPDNLSPGRTCINPTKYILYQDILYGLFDKHISPMEYTNHFEKCTNDLKSCIDRNNDWNYLFDSAYKLCDLLQLKCNVGIGIREAYITNNTTKLQQYADEILPDLHTKLEEFMKTYRKQWSIENKIFGLDVFDIRIGGLIQRNNTAISRIKDYLNNDIDIIEELEEEILYYDCRSEDKPLSICSNLWHEICTPSVIAGV